MLRGRCRNARVSPEVSLLRLKRRRASAHLLQNKRTGGGWATYENTRSYGWLEYINPAETFGDIMIDYSYVECSSACITALSAFRKKFPNHRKQEIEAAIRTPPPSPSLRL